MGISVDEAGQAVTAERGMEAERFDGLQSRHDRLPRHGQVDAGLTRALGDALQDFPERDWGRMHHRIQRTGRYRKAFSDGDDGFRQVGLVDQELT